MRPISVPVHALIDYPLALALMIAPSELGLSRAGLGEDLTIRGIGAAVLVLALVTRYDLGLIPVFSMRAHRNLEVLTGLVLVFAPFVGGFSVRGSRIYLAFGLGQVLLALLTHIGRREDLAFRRRHAGL